MGPRCLPDPALKGISRTKFVTFDYEEKAASSAGPVARLNGGSEKPAGCLLLTVIQLRPEMLTAGFQLVSIKCELTIPH